MFTSRHRHRVTIPFFFSPGRSAFSLPATDIVSLSPIFFFFFSRASVSHFHFWPLIWCHYLLCVCVCVCVCVCMHIHIGDSDICIHVYVYIYTYIYIYIATDIVSLCVRVCVYMYMYMNLYMYMYIHIRTCERGDFLNCLPAAWAGGGVRGPKRAGGVFWD